MKYILSIAVGGIILLHSVIPHEHCVEINNTPEFQANEGTGTILASVKLSFILDHGEGHLEQFVEVQLDVPELLLSNILEAVFVVDDNFFSSSDDKENYTLLNIPPEPLRGPPC